MESEGFNPIAIGAGVLVMILFALISVNIFESVPVIGPFAGGIVAGFIAGKGLVNGGKAGLYAGLIGAVLVSVDFMANLGILRVNMQPLPPVTGVLFLILALFYFSVIAFLGGAIGGRVRR
jgi:uncharacterized membrane protein (Fun14 family)